MSTVMDASARAATAAANLAASIDARPDVLHASQEALQAAFHGIEEAEGVRIAKAIGAGLEAVAEITGDRRAWAMAWHYMPSPGRRAAAADFAARLDAWSVQNQPKPDTPRRKLAKFALKLLRAGTTGRELLRRLDEANATMTEPVSAEMVGEIAVWASRAVTEGRRHAA